jgi:hypothetical protein
MATLERVRAALAELHQSRFLDLGKPYEEETTYEQTRGRRKIAEVRWTLFPSNLFAEEIVQSNVELRTLKSKCQLPELPGL